MLTTPPGILLDGRRPDVDAGSLSRWVDCTYCSIYACFSLERTDELDLYDLGKSKDVKKVIFAGCVQHRVLRAF